MSQNAHIKLAQHAAEHIVLQADTPLAVPRTVPFELMRQQACYVTVFEQPGRRPRSWYGQLLPTTPSLAEEIMVNTAHALQSSARPFRRQDLRQLAYEIAVIGPLERIGGPAQLDIERYGLYLQSNQGATAVILPHRPGIETPADQIATAFREAGIESRVNSPTLYRFSVTYFS